MIPNRRLLKGNEPEKIDNEPDTGTLIRGVVYAVLPVIVTWLMILIIWYEILK